MRVCCQKTFEMGNVQWNLYHNPLWFIDWCVRFIIASKVLSHNWFSYWRVAYWGSQAINTWTNANVCIIWEIITNLFTPQCVYLTLFSPLLYFNHDINDFQVRIIMHHCALVSLCVAGYFVILWKFVYPFFFFFFFSYLACWARDWIWLSVYLSYHCCHRYLLLSTKLHVHSCHYYQ